MRRKNTLRTSARYRAVGLLLTLIVGAFGLIGLFAHQWRRESKTIRCTVEGTFIAQPREIIRAAAIPDSVGLADIDLRVICERIERHPFVKQAELTRNPPEELRIRVIERKPIAYLFGRDDRQMLIDDDGVLLPQVSSPYIYDLPVITGIAGESVLPAGKRILNPRLQQALDVLHAAKTVDEQLYHLFSEINLDRRQDLILYTIEYGIPVIIGPSLGAERKLRYFEAFWNQVVRQAGGSQLEYIDLRFQERVVAKWGDQFIKPAPAVKDSIIEEL